MGILKWESTVEPILAGAVGNGLEDDWKVYVLLMMLKNRLLMMIRKLFKVVCGRGMGDGQEIDYLWRGSKSAAPALTRTSLMLIGFVLTLPSLLVASNFAEGDLDGARHPGLWRASDGWWLPLVLCWEWAC